MTILRILQRVAPLKCGHRVTSARRVVRGAGMSGTVGEVLSERIAVDVVFRMHLPRSAATLYDYPPDLEEKAIELVLEQAAGFATAVADEDAS